MTINSLSSYSVKAVPQITFFKKLQAKWEEDKFVCAGLDSADFELNKSVINETYDLVCSYKLNSAFYEAWGIKGLMYLKSTIGYIHKKDPDIPVILDAKRGDTGNTNEEYAKAIFDYFGVDAITVNPYLGKESLEPFLKRTDKGMIVLVKTSNPGAGEFQDLMIDGQPLYQVIAEHVAKDWNSNGNCAVVAGATYPEELKKVREIIGDMPILIPGVGVQGGDIKQTVKSGLNSKKQGIIINSSRGIIFAPNPREAALKLTNQIKSIIADLSS